MEMLSTVTTLPSANASSYGRLPPSTRILPTPFPSRRLKVASAPSSSSLASAPYTSTGGARLVAGKGARELGSPNPLRIAPHYRLHLRVEAGRDPARHLQPEERVRTKVDLPSPCAATLADIAAVGQPAGVLIDGAESAKGTKGDA